MVERSERFPHIQLRLTTEGIAAPASSGPRKQNPQTAANASARWGHGSRLKSSVQSLILYWKDTQEKREEEEKSPLAEALPIILQIDPSSFDPDGLRTYGIEIIAELENGYIIGASTDIELSELQKKIEKFIKEEQGGSKVSEIWEIIDGTRRPQYILSPELLNHWDNIRDEQIYTVDVGVACVGTKSQLPDYPKRKPDESDDKFKDRVNRWINKRELTEEQWDDLAWKRQQDLAKFVEVYKGNIVSNRDGKIPIAARLPDSFSCRIQIAGRGLKDLVLNFPYIFDVSEPDQFTEIIQRQGLPGCDAPSFRLEPPESNSPKVCVIDSGIQERHHLLKVAIDSDNSRSWVPQQVTRSGKQQAVCWIQNARVLDENRKLPEQLFPPNLLGDVVEFYHSQTGTRIFNHSITGSVPCRTRYMSAWASAIDQLTWQNDIGILFDF